MKAIEVNIIITGIRAKVDGSLGISMTTPELTPEEKAEFMRLQSINLNAILTPLDEKDAPAYKIDKELEIKTPSNRLRSVLYVLWEQEGSKGEFDDFYKKYMSKFIDAVKGMLE
jgi:hypothetical protein